MADSRAMTFPETSYGIVKRLQTIESWADRVAQRLGAPSLSILDFGCGTGDHVTYPLACLGHRVLGVDMHEPSIQEAQRRYPLPNLLFRMARLESLIEEGHKFDLIVCSEVLEHLHRPQDCLALLRRLLQPVGALVITTPNGYGSYELLCRLQRGLTSLGIDQLLRRAVHARRERKARAVEAAIWLNEVAEKSNTGTHIQNQLRQRQATAGNDLHHVAGKNGPPRPPAKPSRQKAVEQF
mgnify:CR=1 FL=1